MDTSVKKLPPIAIRKLSLPFPSTNPSFILDHIKSHVSTFPSESEEVQRFDLSEFSALIFCWKRPVENEFVKGIKSFLEHNTSGQQYHSEDNESEEDDNIDDEDDDDDVKYHFYNPDPVTTTSETKTDVLMMFIKCTNEYPDIFVVSSGQVWRVIEDDYWDQEFPNTIAKRVLEFKVKDLTTHNLTGEATTKAMSYRQGHEAQPSLWSFLGSIAVSYTMPLRENNPLYRLDCFKTKTNAPKNISAVVGKTYIKFKLKFDLKSIAKLLRELLKFFSWNDANYDRRFVIFEHVKLIKNKERILDLNEALGKELEIKKNADHGLFLSYKDPVKWNDASTVKLLLKHQQREYKTLYEWMDAPPLLFEVLQHTVAPIDCMYLEIRYKDGRIKQPLLNFVEGQIICPGIDDMSVFRHGGKWLTISMEYMVELDQEFSIQEQECTVDPKVLPLPWVCSRQDDVGKEFSSFPKEWIYSFDVYDDEVNTCLGTILSKALEQQREADYNELYILFDEIVRSKYDDTGYLLGDRILVQNVELFDIMYYTPDSTYLIHVKEGFGQSTRDVCSQIRVSAEMIFRSLVTDSGFDVLREFWDKACEEHPDNYYRERVRQMYTEKFETSDTFRQLFETTKIIYVLAYRDTKKSSAHDPGNLKSGENLYDKLHQTFNARTERVVTMMEFHRYIKRIRFEITATDKMFCSKKAAKEDIKQQIVNVFDTYRSIMQSLSHSSFHTLQIIQSALQGTSTNVDILICLEWIVPCIFDANYWTFQTNEQTLNNTMRIWLCSVMEAYSIIRKTLSRHNSTLAKMEIVQLFKHFQKFATPKFKFQLKICSISKSDPGWV